MVKPLRRRGLLPVAAVAFALLAPGAAGAAPIATGAYIPDSYKDPGLIDSYGRLAGRKPVIVLSYKSWSIPPFDRREMGEIWARGAVPMVTWEPWTDSERGVPLRAISAGRYDSVSAALRPCRRRLGTADLRPLRPRDER